MNASSNSSVKTTEAAGDCLTCDIPVFCRNYYYRGKLLTERDFWDEQRYHRDKLRLHTRLLHGWGVVCGLAVKPHPHCPQLRLVVEEGLAIDCCGHEIRVLKDSYVELPQPPKKPVPEPRPPSAEPPPAEGEGMAEPCEPGPTPKELFLCICYTECDTEYSPAPFDDCGCATGNGLRPNRVCEGYRLELFDEKPSFWDEATGRCGCEVVDCCDLYGDGCEPCHDPHETCCVPLALIVDFVPGEQIRPEQIRVRGHRRQLASTETLDKVLRCLLDKMPCEELTQIDDTNWEHGQRYLCREFMSEFVERHEPHGGFRISFTRKVRSRAINTRSFQAYVVFQHEDRAAPRHLELAPAEVLKDQDETDWCRLIINPDYARQRLEGRTFDFYITLKCDVIVDLHGLAVDGNFIGERLPTGDRVQGGTFESWFHVAPRRVDQV